MRKIQWLILLGLSFSLLGSCRKEDGPVGGGFEPREMVPVQLYLGAESPVYVVDGQVQEDVKSSEHPFPYSSDRGDDQVIYNLWILEFEQIGDQFVLNAQPTYVANYPSYFDESGMAVKTIGVPASRYKCTLLFMANTGLPDMTFSPGTTLEQFKEARFAEIDAQEDLFGWDPDAEKFAPRFNGTTVTEVNPGITRIGGPLGQRIPLRRAMAMVDITLVNQSLRDPSIPTEERVTMRHVRLNNVQNKSFYYTNYPDYEESFTLNRPNEAVPLDVTSDGYDWTFSTARATDWGRVRYFRSWYKNGTTYPDPGTDPDAIQAALADGAVPTEASVRFFVPGNLRPESVSEATSVTLVGSYTKNGVNYDATYEIPIMEQNPADGKYYYAVRPNHYYDYRITLRRLGDTDVEDHADNGVVDLTQKELANSYIVNPPSSADFHTVYKVPVAKANYFWGDSRYEADTKVEIYGSQQPAATSIGDVYPRDLVLGEDDQWRAIVLWADFDWTGKVDLVDLYGLGKGVGKGASVSGQGCFGLEVAGGTKGNLVVAVLKTLSGNSHELESVVWSWHFWITDYNPDTPVTLHPGKYLYTVSGGRVFRLNNPIFNTGRYKNSYLMDRALGSWFNPMEDQYQEYISGSDLPDDVRNGSRLGIGLYYQFGRKDPFTIRGTYYDYTGALHTDMDGDNKWTKNHNDAIYRLTVPDQQKHRTLLWYSNVNYNDGYNYDQVAMTVMYPIIKPSTSKDQWTMNGVYKPLPFNPDIFWNDPYFDERTEEDASNLMGYRKSIFDPCPPGWVVPSRGESHGKDVYYQILDNLNAKEGTYWKYWNPVVFSGHQRGVLVWPDGREIPNAEITSSMLKTAVFIPAAPNSQKGLPLGSVWAPDQCSFHLGYPTGINDKLEFLYPYAQIRGNNVTVNAGGRGHDGHQVRCIRNVKPE